MVSEEKTFSIHSTFTVPFPTGRWFRLTTSPYKKMLFVLGFRLAKLLQKQLRLQCNQRLGPILKELGIFSPNLKKSNPHSTLESPSKLLWKLALQLAMSSHCIELIPSLPRVRYKPTPASVSGQKKYSITN